MWMGLLFIAVSYHGTLPQDITCYFFIFQLLQCQHLNEEVLETDWKRPYTEISTFKNNYDAWSKTLKQVSHYTMNVKLRTLILHFISSNTYKYIYNIIQKSLRIRETHTAHKTTLHMLIYTLILYLLLKYQSLIINTVL